MKAVLVVVVALVLAAQAKVFFEENFDAKWTDRWVVSKAKGDAAGSFKTRADQYWSGIQTSEDMRFYQASAAFPKFSNKGSDLVLQYVVRHEQIVDCGGAYLKFGPSGLVQSEFHGESPYNIMFGPDHCGSTNRVHVIFAYKGTNHLITKTITPKKDQLSHVYTLIVKPDNTYQVLIDGEEAASGSLESDWTMLPPKEINDPAQSKPADWVDAPKMADPSAVKPAGWDDIPATVADPDAKKPDDWDDELDGHWEVPQIPNPEYKGEWKAPLIDNPAYKGPWVHPKIANPDYHPDPNMYAYDDFAWVGIDVWQVKSGTIFRSIHISDSLEAAAAHREAAWASTKDAEKAAADAAAEAKRAEAAAAAEAAKAAAGDAADGDAKDEL